ncbi:unnamed protein product [Allacma fusca]|uniref:mannosyl-oligosaccharide 1,3-1,6-alpha-mannosidase n=1 Tax=Allacma fusca TaxID=39272 RepID=A0A8J2JX27_9HEXA|nr:unnamed protein product [Allacma fusca]
MNIKKVFVIGTAGFVAVCLGLFYILNSTLPLRSNNKLDYEKVEAKLDLLEKAVYSHRKSMSELESLLENVPRVEDNMINSNNEIDVPKKEIGQNIDVGTMFKAPQGGGSYQLSNTCSAAFKIGTEAKSDINMLNVYDELPFDDVDGGVWKQGWDVQPDLNRFTASNKLRVIVIPHSHNDPGWIKTFENYYETQTKGILNSMLDKLSVDKSLKFIWAEISYFSMWWDDLSEKDRIKVKKLVENKQLEFVTGGWVMPDEASSHYFSMLTQLIEGHQWLLHHLDYIPKNGWSIDPFGMSPTNAYLLRRAGLSNMLIQRTHYAVKKYLAKKQELEFNWRQIWDTKGTADMFCHMMPFYSYDVPHTCGPDPSVCCQFDFKRMRGISHVTCPWHKAPQPIRPQNIKERALLLLDQYRKKAMLYKTNVLLVPLGDDFRWEDHKEWDAQTSNYGRLFNYINSNEDLFAEAKFGTLDDYFEELKKEVTDGSFKPKVLSGDFFTYSDRNDHYWSGYFTSRPFHKSADRQLMALLQSAQMTYMLMTAEISRRWGNLGDHGFVRNLLGKLIKSRRTLSLFQHHDGITGTSKDHVVTDYAQKMYSAMNDCNHVMQQSLHVLSHLADNQLSLGDITENTDFYKPIISKDTHTEIPHYNLLYVDVTISEKIIKVFNPSIRRRVKLVRLYVSTYKIEVTDLLGNIIPHELLPVFESETTISGNNFELTFVAEIESLSVKNYVVKHSATDKIIPKPEILIFNSPNPITEHKVFGVNNMPSPETIQISNGYMTVNFNEDGFTNSVSVNGKEHSVKTSFASYGAQSRSETSGLYLFFPDGNAVPLPVVKPLIRVIKGKFQSYVEVWLTQVKHRVTIFNHPGFEHYAIEIKNLVDIRREKNYELSMKIATDINSKTAFQTDLNGFQMIRRKWYSKIPIQANFYPITTSAYIESGDVRMTLLTAQSLGGTSLKSGELEIMMDRRLLQDDNRGAGQGCTDNLETMHVFRVVFEKPVCTDPQADISPPMLSLAAHLQLQDLQLPLQMFSAPHQTTKDSLSGVSDYIPVTPSEAISCDVELLSAVPLPDYADSMDDHSYITAPKSSLLFHRFGFDGRFLGAIPLPYCAHEESKLGRINIKQIFGDLVQPKIQQATLSFLIEGKDIASNDSILMKPMEVYGFMTRFHIKR